MNRPSAVFFRPSHGVQFWAVVRDGSRHAGSFSRSSNHARSPIPFGSGAAVHQSSKRIIAISLSFGARAPVVFHFISRPLRVVMIDGVPWFVAADVCAVLDIKNTAHAMTRLDDDERVVVLLRRKSSRPSARPAAIMPALRGSPPSPARKP